MAAFGQEHGTLAAEKEVLLKYSDFDEVPGELTGSFFKAGFSSGKFQKRAFCLRSGMMCYSKPSFWGIFYDGPAKQLTPMDGVVPVDALTTVAEQRAGSLPVSLAFSGPELARTVLPHDGLAVNLPNRENGGRRVYYLCSPDAALRRKWKQALELLAAEKASAPGLNVILPWDVHYAMGWTKTETGYVSRHNMHYRLDINEEPGTNDHIYVKVWRKSSEPGGGFTSRGGEYCRLYPPSAEDREGFKPGDTYVEFKIRSRGGGYGTKNALKSKFAPLH